MKRLRRAVVLGWALVAPIAVAAAVGAPSAVAAEARFRFVAAPYTVTEDQAMLRVVVERTDLPVARVVVEYHTESGTAKAGEDYVDAAGGLVFDVGQTSASFTIFLKNDTIPEPREYLVLRLAEGTEAYEPATVTVLDDDAPPAPDGATSTNSVGSSTGATASGSAGGPSAGMAPIAASDATPIRTATTPRIADPSPVRRVARPRVVAATSRRVTVRQSPVTPFELRPAQPDVAAAAGPPLDIDPFVAVLAGLLLARIGAELWFRTRPGLS